jgi:hypothetical protein
MKTRLVALSTSVVALTACGSSDTQEPGKDSGSVPAASSTSEKDLIAAIDAGQTGKHECFDPAKLDAAKKVGEVHLLEKIQSESTVTIDDGLGGYIVLCTTSCPKNAPKLCKVQPPPM